MNNLFKTIYLINKTTKYSGSIRTYIDPEIIYDTTYSKPLKSNLQIGKEFSSRSRLIGITIGVWLCECHIFFIC